MITIISGSNRRNSECLTFAEKYKEILEEQTDEPVKLLALEAIPHDWFHPEMYSSKGQSESIRKIQDDYLLPANKFAFFLPEYNGGFPGVVKLLIDACSVRKYRATFQGKKAGLIGIASGRAGNLLGMDQFCSVLHHLGTVVMPNKLPISRIEELTDSHGEIVDEKTLLLLHSHAKELLDF
jgi:chromate reductase